MRLLKYCITRRQCRIKQDSAADITAAAALAVQSINQLSAAVAGSRSEFKWTRRLMEFQNEKNLENWNRQNQYNLPSQQMQRFIQAGLNPNLIYGQNNEASQPSSVALGKTPDIADINSRAAAGVTSALSAGYDMRMRQQQFELQKADVESNIRLRDSLSNLRDTEQELKDANLRWFKVLHSSDGTENGGIMSMMSEAGQRYLSESANLSKETTMLDLKNRILKPEADSALFFTNMAMRAARLKNTKLAAECRYLYAKTYEVQTLTPAKYELLLRQGDLIKANIDFTTARTEYQNFVNFTKSIGITDGDSIYMRMAAMRCIDSGMTLDATKKWLMKLQLGEAAVKEALEFAHGFVSFKQKAALAAQGNNKSYRSSPDMYSGDGSMLYNENYGF